MAMVDQETRTIFDPKEFKSNNELNSHLLDQAAKLFSDPTLDRVTLRNVEGWQEKFPELAKRFSTLKSHKLQILSFLYDKPPLEPVVGNGIVDVDETEDDWEEEEEEESVLAVELTFLPPGAIYDAETGDEDEEEEDSSNSEVRFSLFDKDRYAEMWSSIEEKPNLFMERSTNTRQGVGTRLKIIAELLSYALDITS